MSVSYISLSHRLIYMLRRELKHVAFGRIRPCTCGIVVRFSNVTTIRQVRVQIPPGVDLPDFSGHSLLTQEEGVYTAGSPSTCGCVDRWLNIHTNPTGHASTGACTLYVIVGACKGLRWSTFTQRWRLLRLPPLQGASPMRASVWS